MSNLSLGSYTLRGSPRQVFQDGELALTPEVGILAVSWWLSQLKRGRVTKVGWKSPLLLGLQHQCSLLHMHWEPGSGRSFLKGSKS